MDNFSELPQRFEILICLRSIPMRGGVMSRGCACVYIIWVCAINPPQPKVRKVVRHKWCQDWPLHLLEIRIEAKFAGFFNVHFKIVLVVILLQHLLPLLLPRACWLLAIELCKVYTYMHICIYVYMCICVYAPPPQFPFPPSGRICGGVPPSPSPARGEGEGG